MRARATAQALGRAHREGKNWRCNCPLCGGHNLTLADGSNGALLITCFDNCDRTEILAELRRRGLQPERQPRRNGLDIVATYDYRDEDGALLFQVCRLDPKSFLQRRRDGQGWVWSTKGVRRVLYRLPELIAARAAANGQAPRVYVCEGEKDVDRLCQQWGLLATCNPGGAEKWRGEFNPYLAGCDVVIVPDADEAGRKHATDVVRSLTGVAAKIRAIELPGAKDVSDWLDYHPDATQNDFETLVECVAVVDEPAIIPITGPQPRKGPEDEFDLGEWDFGAAGIDPAKIQPRGWLLGTWICRQFLSALFGDGAVGKTAVRIACALALATGRHDILNEHVFQQCRVLFLCFEDGEEELKRRICAAMIHHHISDTDIAGYLFVRAITRSQLKLAAAGEFGKIEQGPLVDALKAAIARRQLDAVFFDPLIKTHSVSENDNRAMDLVSDILVDFSVEHNLGVDTPHHITKGTASPGNADSGRGATAIKDGGRLIYTLTPMSEKEAEIFGIRPEERAQFVRVDQGKVNLIRRTDTAKWLRLVGVNLGNKNDLYPHGDNVQTVEPWYPPDIWRGLGNVRLNAILDVFDKGPINDDEDL
jgi:hypothetical protein